MRWKKKYTEPKDGDIKTVKRFAWVPTDVENDYVCWLEPYYHELIFREYMIPYGRWVSVRNYQSPIYLPDYNYESKT